MRFILLFLACSVAIGQQPGQPGYQYNQPVLLNPTVIGNSNIVVNGVTWPAATPNVSAGPSNGEDDTLRIQSILDSIHGTAVCLYIPPGVELVTGLHFWKLRHPTRTPASPAPGWESRSSGPSRELRLPTQPQPILSSFRTPRI